MQFISVYINLVNSNFHLINCALQFIAYFVWLNQIINPQKKNISCGIWNWAQYIIIISSRYTYDICIYIYFAPVYACLPVIYL